MEAGGDRADRADSADRVWSTRGWAFRLAGAGTLPIALGLAYAWSELAAVVVAMVGFHAGTRAARGWWYAAMGLATTAVLLAAASRAGFDSDDLGLRGGVVVSAVVLIVAAAGLILVRVPAVASLLPRVPADRPVLALLVDLPIGTVLVEEVAFRSVGLALLTASTGAVLAVVVSSVLFGLWHVWGAVETSQGPAWRRTVPAAVRFTSVAGDGLCVLRHWLGAVLPAMAVHYAGNAWGIAGASLAWRTRQRRGEVPGPES